MFFLQLLLVFGVLAAGLWAFTRLLQGVIYTEVPPSLTWRAPLAAAIVCAAGILWPNAFNLMATTRWPVNFDQTFLLQNVSETALEFQEFLVPDELGQEVAYQRLKNERGVAEYRDAAGRRIPANPEKLTGVTAEGAKHAYQIVKDAEGFIDRSKGSVRYRDDAGKETSEEILYVGGTAQWNVGQFLVYLAGGFLTWLAWFLSLWLVLLFQWHHALGISIPAMLIWTFLLNFVPGVS